MSRKVSGAQATQIAGGIGPSLIKGESKGLRYGPKYPAGWKKTAQVAKVTNRLSAPTTKVG